MKQRVQFMIGMLLLGLMVWPCVSAGAAPVGTAFTYQGRLTGANGPADGLYDFRFKLFDDPNVADSNQVGPMMFIDEFDLVKGYFTAALDFYIGPDDPNIFAGQARWLEIAIRPGELNDPNEYTVLSPRQQITAAPYALAVRAPLNLVSAGSEPTISSVATAGYRGIAVYGESTQTDGYGVYGRVTGMDSYGIYGEAMAEDSDAVFGRASGQANCGVVGKHIDANTVGRLGDSLYGVYGGHWISGSHGSTMDNYGYLGGAVHGVYGSTVNPDHYAGYFDGPTKVTGNLIIDGNVGIGTTSPESQLSVGSDGHPDAAIHGYSDSGYGVHGSSSTGHGVYGSSSSSHGVLGKSESSIGYGVYGYNSTSGNYGFLGGNSFGVKGTSTSGYAVSGYSDSGYGVYGYSSSSTGVYGESSTRSSYNSIGVYGYNPGSGTSETGIGVYGKSESGYGYGVYGYASATSGGGYGVYGRSGSSSGYGVYGYNSSGGGHGVHGKSTGASGKGVYGINYTRNNIGYLGGYDYGVYGYNSSGGDGVYGRSDSGNGVYGYSDTGWAGYFVGKVNVSGAIYQRGGVLHADYVFEPDYELESIDEHSQFMWQNKHLPAIPKAKTDENGRQIVEVGAHRKGIVEELEKAHIYIEQLHNRIRTLEERLVKLESGLNAVR